MTYCVAMRLKSGLLFASDSRTNAGVDHISTFRKMHIFELPGERLVVLLNSGNLATTQSVVSMLRQGIAADGPPGSHILNVPNLYDAAAMVGATMRKVLDRDDQGKTLDQGVDYSASFLVGGQIKGEAPRLFNVYPQGNFIEATVDTPYFQIGESKYGKPIIDRVLKYETPLAEAAKCTLISFDSTIRSNLSVGLPIDMLLYRADSFAPANPHRVNEGDAYFQRLHRGWGQGLRNVFKRLPDEDWFEG